MQRNAHMGDRRVTPTRRVTAGDSVTTVVTSHVSHGWGRPVRSLRLAHRVCLGLVYLRFCAPFQQAAET